MMLITIKVPDNTAKISYALANEDGYIMEDKPLTAEQLVSVERDREADMIDLGEV